MIVPLVVSALAASPEPTGVDGLNRLQARQVLASSALQNGWNSYDQNYLPPYAVDDDPATAWVEGSPGDGTGESFTWHGPELGQVTALKLAVRNGYQKSKALFAANGRIKAMRVEVLSKENAPLSKDVVLADEPEWQTIELPVGGGFTGLKLTVQSVYAGARYTDLCLSDVRVYAAAKDPYKPEREAAAFEAIKAWAAERQARAKQGLKPQPTYYAAKYKSSKPTDKAALEKTAREQLAQLKGLMEKAPALPDGWRAARVQLQQRREMEFSFLEPLEYWLTGDPDLFYRLAAADLVAFDEQLKRPAADAWRAIGNAKNHVTKCRELFGSEAGLSDCELQEDELKALIGYANRRVHAVHGDLKSFDQVFLSDPGYYGERERRQSEHSVLVTYSGGHATSAALYDDDDNNAEPYREVLMFSWNGEVVSRVCVMRFKAEKSEKLSCVSAA